MAVRENLNRLLFVSISLSLVFSNGYGQSASLTLAPAPDAGIDNLYLRKAFWFFVCDLEGLDVATMSVAWTFNGEVFADAVLDGTLSLRPNINAIYGFQVTTSHFNTELSLMLQDEDDQMYRATLDVLRSEWQYSGEYGCVVCTKNDVNGRCGQILTRSNVILSELVYFPPEPYPLLESSSTGGTESSVVVLGQETVVSCYSYDGNPDVDFSLQRDNEVVVGVTSKSGDFIFYNYTFSTTTDDDGVEFSCQISNSIPDVPPGETQRVRTLSALQVVSIPEVEIEGPKVIGYGSTLKLTCIATSATNTAILEYRWTTDLDPRRFVEDGNTFTIALVADGDSGTDISCHVTDANGMEGTGMYTVDAMDPEDIPVTTAAPPGTPSTQRDTPVALIIVMCIVGFILLVLLVGALCWWYRKDNSKTKFGHQSGSKSMTHPSKNNKDFQNPKDLNGPYTVSSKVANSDAFDHSHHIRDYEPNGEYNHKVSAPYYHDDQDNYRNYPPYERTVSQERFYQYPEDEKRPDYHYNTSYGYDDKRDYPPLEYNDDDLVGDFTQPTDRQPPYGDGNRDYNDGRTDHRDQNVRDPVGSYDDREPLGYDDREPRGYDDRYPEGYDDRNHVGYDERDPVGYYDMDPVGYDEADPTRYNDRDAGSYHERGSDLYDNGYIDERDGGTLPRSPHNDDYKDDYYPSAESYPPQDRYDDPGTDRYGEDYPQGKDRMYPQDDENYDFEPYGERDQVPDGQEADFQGDPYNDPYYPPADRMPDGGPPQDDPYFGYDINPELDQFDTPDKSNADSFASDRFDPSYV